MTGGEEASSRWTSGAGGSATVSKRILVIGSPGSGKSTFSRTLSDMTQIPLIHLDNLYWQADKTTVPKELFLQRLQEVLRRDTWIIDGNYGSTMELRIRRSEEIIFLDIPPAVCLEGIYARFGKPRDDMPWIETEPDEEFLSFVRRFPIDGRPKILALLEKYAEYAEKKIRIFSSMEEAALYLEQLKQPPAAP